MYLAGYGLLVKPPTQLSVFRSMSEGLLSVGQTVFTDRCYNFGSMAVQIMKKNSKPKLAAAG